MSKEHKNVNIFPEKKYRNIYSHNLSFGSLAKFGMYIKENYNSVRIKRDFFCTASMIFLTTLRSLTR